MWNIPNRQVETNNSDTSYTMKTTKEENFGTNTTTNLSQTVIASTINTVSAT